MKEDIGDILIDIFVGRDPEDLQQLGLAYQRKHSLSMQGKSLASLVKEITKSEELQAALTICIEGGRGLMPVDQAAIQNDLVEIKNLMKMAFPPPRAFFDILLRRSDPHIASIALYYSMESGLKLDEAIRRNMSIPSMTRKIVLHAVRSATDLPYRDVMLLRDAMVANNLIGNVVKEKLGIRVCRMHWHRRHWQNVKAVYVGHKGEEFVDKWKNKKGIFRDLIMSMASI